METLVAVGAEPSRRLRSVFSGRSVFVTGHTGFKGSWLCEWLLSLGAKVTGFSLPPPTKPSLFEQLQLSSRLQHFEGEICDSASVSRALHAARPAFVFHLAAQPLVRRSYQEPARTYAVNVLGTAHVLDAVRERGEACVVVAITTDKCYENREWLHAYREEDPLGGHDPYSASKAAAELVIASYRRSFFHSGEIRLASARAGNVIGGGDWASDRIVPDCMRSLDRGEILVVRNPRATRPWQHVLEPLGGYLALAAALAGPQAPVGLAGAFNFGPTLESNRDVEALVTEILKHRPGAWRDESDPKAPHEAQRLNLAVDKAFHLLGWHPLWSFERAVAETVLGYQAQTCDAVTTCVRSQIAAYAAEAAGEEAWAQ